jgi:hypothetical protein
MLKGRPNRELVQHSNSAAASSWPKIAHFCQNETSFYHAKSEFNESNMAFVKDAILAICFDKRPAQLSARWLLFFSIAFC